VPELGYSLSCEEHAPNDLVGFAKSAEAAGFGFALVSDHFHPWIDAQGNSPFVWSVIGGVAQATERLRLGTGVTCPLIRIHPAIIAQAAATAQVMMEGRFYLGLGTGEELNEHVVGARWPGPQERLEMLEEAIEILRLLWQGGYQTHRGKHYTVERARIYTLPEQLPEICVAAAQPNAAELAGRIGDGFIGVAPEEELIEKFEQAGGDGKPRYGHLTVCWAEDEEQAKQTAHQNWPNAGLEGPLNQELATPADFEAVAEMVEPDDLETLPLGPDPDRYLDAIREFDDAGYSHVYIHQIGPNQDGFLEFARRELLPRL